MKKIKFVDHILPHIVAVFVFFVVTIIFFRPVFFDNKSLKQHDIQQWIASSKSLKEYREKTGEEGLWTNSMFSGMPAYLVDLQWSGQGIYQVKRILSFGLPHPFLNIYWAFLSYYILLLAFRVRPMLAIAGALAFGLSSYMIIGLAAGHNSRIGSIAYMPLVIAGIHLVFSNKQKLGLGITAMGLALHLKENHLQMTYYLIFILLAYGLVHLTFAFCSHQLKIFFQRLLTLVPVVLIVLGCFFGLLWSIIEYSQYSIRGVSELTTDRPLPAADTGLTKDYVFAYSNGIAEPMTLFIPNFFGGSSAHFFVQNDQSASYKALSQYNDPRLVNQLARYTSAYWGPQSNTSPYYAGAVMCFLFVLGILFAERKYIWWLLPVSILGIVLSWGSHFQLFNYFLFDYFPGYSKFRSVTFALVITFFAIPLLGMLGLEKIFKSDIGKIDQKKILVAFLSMAGACLLLWLFAGIMGFVREAESVLPAWFLDALRWDRKDLFRRDVLRSLFFISFFFIILFLNRRNYIPNFLFFVLLIITVTLDLSWVDQRYLSADNYQRRYNRSAFLPSAVDEELMKDKTYYRVYNLQEPWGQSARTAYFHHSINGYHGAKLRRYQDLYDSCIFKETNRFIEEVQKGTLDLTRYEVLNMLNVKYIVFGSEKTDFIVNTEANGNAWCVRHVKKAYSPLAELAALQNMDTRQEAVVDISKFELPDFQYDSTTRISLKESNLNYLSYEYSGSVNSMTVFSEIFYPLGWHAFIDGKEVPILRADYVLRALVIPAGNHLIEFRFEPRAYTMGNKIMVASSWGLIIWVLGSIGWSIRSGEFET